MNVFKSRIKLFFTFNSITNEKLKIIENCSGMKLKNIRKKIKINNSNYFFINVHPSIEMNLKQNNSLFCNKFIHCRKLFCSLK